MILNGFGKFCCMDEDEDFTAQEQIRGLMRRMVDEHVQKEEQDESSDFDG
jgi:hypothetical protein